MGIGRGRRRGRKDHQRKPGDKSGRRVLIACEGGETEPGYFAALKRNLRLPGVTILGKEIGPAPINVVDSAIDARRAGQRSGEPFDAVWCVFDRDSHSSFAQAVDKARSNKLRIAISVPCFEFWLLLHYEYTSRPCDDFDDLRKNKLAIHLPDYDKAQTDWDQVLSGLEQAKSHAERLRSSQEHEPEHTNPSTNVDELVTYLQRLKTPQG